MAEHRLFDWDLPSEADPQEPRWALVGPDEQGNFFIHWKAHSSERIQGLPLGSFKKIARKLRENAEVAKLLK